MIAGDLAFDIWKWQKSQPDGPVRYKCSKGGNADGLERSVFTCPSCGAFGTLKSKGDSIGCSCGFKLRMEDTGFFEEGGPFETVADWEESDRKRLAERLDEIRRAERAEKKGRAAGEDVVFTDDAVVLHRIEELSFSGGKFILNISDCSFDLEDISNMTMVLAGRIVFSDRSGYYELLSDKKNRTNLRKYVIARDLLLKE